MRITHWQLFVFIVCLLAVLFALAMVVKAESKPRDPNLPPEYLPDEIKQVVDIWLDPCWPLRIVATVIDPRDPEPPTVFILPVMQRPVGLWLFARAAEMWRQRMESMPVQETQK